MKKLICTVALVGALAIPGAAQAQTTVGGGGLYHTDFEAIGLMAFARFGVPSLHENISIAGSFGFYFPDGFDAWELNGDVIYAFPVGADTPVMPFALAGLNVVNVSFDAGAFGSASSTDIGLNLGGGIEFPAESVNPFVGAKFEIQDGTGFVIFGGVGFPVG